MGIQVFMNNIVGGEIHQLSPSLRCASHDCLDPTFRFPACGIPRLKSEEYGVHQTIKYHDTTPKIIGYGQQSNPFAGGPHLALR